MRAAAPGRCARGAGRDRSPVAPGTPGCVRAGSSTPAASPRPAASRDAGHRSCRSWAAFYGRGPWRYRPTQRDARRSRRRPAPRRHTASPRTPPLRTPGACPLSLPNRGQRASPTVSGLRTSPCSHPCAVRQFGHLSSRGRSGLAAAEPPQAVPAQGQGQGEVDRGLDPLDGPVAADGAAGDGDPDAVAGEAVRPGGTPGMCIRQAGRLVLTGCPAALGSGPA